MTVKLWEYARLVAAVVAAFVLGWWAAPAGAWERGQHVMTVPPHHRACQVGVIVPAAEGKVAARYGLHVTIRWPADLAAQLLRPAVPPPAACAVDSVPIPTGRPAAVVCSATETRIAANLIRSGADRYRLPRGADAGAVLLAGCEGRRLACPAGWAATAERILRALGPRYGLREIARLSAAMRSACGQ